MLSRLSPSLGIALKLKALLTLLVPLLLLLSQVRLVLGQSTTYTLFTARDLYDFSVEINEGTRHPNTTVFLSRDMDFSEVHENFEPIGINAAKYFEGVFDGQGYAISNLFINSSYQQTGLFGYSVGAVIRNVILDESCKVISSYSSDYEGFLGSMIGHCHSRASPCTISNTVNMGSVSFEGKIRWRMDIGGIAGHLTSSSKYSIALKNCANYGTISHTGSSNIAKVGGLVGMCEGYSSDIYIQNCANYGFIKHRRIALKESTHIGGIAGYSLSGGVIRYCLNAGMVDAYIRSTQRIGGILGGMDPNTHAVIDHCFWTKNYTDFLACNCSKEGVNISNSSLTDVNATVIHKLNNYVNRSNSWSKWTFRANDTAVSIVVNGQNLFWLKSQLTLLPDLEEGSDLFFSGWYTNKECTKRLEEYEFKENTTLYGGWEYTIDFDTHNGTNISSITLPYKTTVMLPNNTMKPGCKFQWWENKFGDKVPWNYTIPARNVTLCAVWACTNITTADDLVELAKIVSIGGNYLGTTVLLKNDIEFSAETSEKFKPIGIDTINHFLGTFDGQGHVIKNLSIRSTLRYAGIFGYTTGAHIRNVVIDASCSVVNTYYSYPDIGGIIGRCSATYSPTIVENCVNMGNVTFNESTGSFLFIGGIAGLIISNNYMATIRNCVNYGSVTFAGRIGSRVFAGGIVGESEGILNKYIQNCVNYGTVSNKGETVERFYVGGIIGSPWFSFVAVENCLNAGKIILDKDNTFAGSVVGFTHSAIKIDHTFWLKQEGFENPNGTVDTSITLNITNSSLIEQLNTTTMDNLNSYNSSWDKWFILYLNGGNINNFSLTELVVTQKHFPDPVKEGHTFLFWCLDTECNEKYDPDTTDTTNVTGLYAGWKINYYTISFVVRDGTSVDPITGKFNETVNIPNKTTRSNCEFMWWETDSGTKVFQTYTIEARNVTFRAVWLCTSLVNANDLIDFSEVVNSKSLSFEGITVFLDDEVDFTGNSRAFEPIGKDDNTRFKGVFDGNGYVIKGLAVKSASQHVGLFGCTEGAIIRNVVMDGSCSVTSSYTGSNDAYVGGFVGHCTGQYIKRKLQMIENSVNMGGVTYDGSVNARVSFVGGIAGDLINGYIKNCVNYGAVTHKGTSDKNNVVGGLVGSLQGYVQNSLNHGSVVHSGNSHTEKVLVGGVIGSANIRTKLTNCVSTGKIQGGSGAYVGSIVGQGNKSLEIENCLWTSDVGSLNCSGRGDPETRGSGRADIDTNTLDRLNGYASENKWNRWLLNREKFKVTFKVWNRKGSVTFESQLIILPDIAENSKFKFEGWYTDDKCANKFTETQVNKNTILYGKVSEKKINTFIIAIIVVISVVCVSFLFFIIIFALGHYLFQKLKMNKETQMMIEPLLFDRLSDTLDDMGYLYPEGYKKQDLETALVNAGVPEAIAKELTADCYRRAEALEKDDKLPPNITVDEAAAIGLYTTETSRLVQNPYSIVNGALMYGTAEALEPVKDLLYLVMTAMRKMPISYGKPLYRGICNNVFNEKSINKDKLSEGTMHMSTAAADGDNSDAAGNEEDYRYRAQQEFDDDYDEGEEIVWRALSSTSPNVAVTKAFLAKGTASGKAEGTLFIIEGGWGYNVQPCSMYPTEEEIVLEPERRFKVKTVIPGEGLTIIKIEMLKTPVVLPEVFGELNVWH